MDIINLEKAKKLMDGDKDLYKELMVIVEGSIKEKYSNIELALKNRVPEDLEMYAHQFKGALRNMAADECCSILEELEKCGKQSDFSKAQELYHQVKPAVERFLEEYKTGKWEKSFY
jgi:HPt (histidine-containing phosphotransfer) domain-containing protein